MTPRPRHNPKAPFRRTGPAPKPGSVLEQFVDRLRLLGADDEILDGVRQAWGDPTWTNRDQIVGLNDAALRREIEAIFTEYEFHTTDPDGDLDEGGTGSVPDGTVAEVLGWVDGDPGRAAIARDAEQARDKPRAGVMTILASILGGD